MVHAGFGDGVRPREEAAAAAPGLRRADANDAVDGTDAPEAAAVVAFAADDSSGDAYRGTPLSAMLLLLLLLTGVV